MRRCCQHASVCALYVGDHKISVVNNVCEPAFTIPEGLDILSARNETQTPECVAFDTCLAPWKPIKLLSGEGARKAFALLRQVHAHTRGYPFSTLRFSQSSGGVTYVSKAARSAVCVSFRAVVSVIVRAELDTGTWVHLSILHIQLHCIQKCLVLLLGGRQDFDLVWIVHCLSRDCLNDQICVHFRLQKSCDPKWMFHFIY